MKKRTGFNKKSFSKNSQFSLLSKNEKLKITSTLSSGTNKNKKPVHTASELKEKYSNLMNNMSSVILQIDMKGRVVFLNKFGEHLFGYKEKEIVGKSIIGTLVSKKIFSGKDFNKMAISIINNPKKYLINESEMMQKNGGRVWVLWTNKAVLDEEGKIVGILSVGTDITERKRKEKETSEYFKNLEFLSTSAIQFLSRMSYHSLFSFIGKRLFPLAEEAIVVVNEYDMGAESTTVRFLQGQKKDIKKITDIFGKNPVGIVLKVPENIRKRMIAGMFVKVEGGLYDLAFKQLPLPLCKKIEQELNLGDVYTMPFVMEDDFLGTVGILTKKNKVIKNKHLIESFISLSAVALKHKKVEDELRESEEVFRAIFEDAAIGIALSDMKGHPVVVNPTFQRMIGYSYQELRNMVFNDFTYTDDLILDKDMFREMKKGGRESYTLEKRYVKKDGNVIWVLVTVSLIRDFEGKPKFTIGVIRDITEHKKVETALEESSEKFRKIFADSPIGIGLHNSAGYLVEANKACLDIFGVSDIKEIQKYNLFNDPYSESKNKERLKLGKKVEFETVFDYEKIKKLNLYRTDKSGSIFVDVLITPMFTEENKKIFGYLIQLHDITERKELEERKDEFISIASHELKTPITSIKGFSQIMRKRMDEIGDEKFKYYLLRMDKQIDSLHTLVSDLLDVSRIQSKKIEFKMEGVLVDKLVKECVENLQETTDKHKIILNLKTKKQVIADRARIYQVLTNLINNAIKYSPEGKKIIVSLTENKEYLTVKVKDFGIGIPEKEQKKIFERFYRVQDKSREKFPGGLGLGLFISSEIVKEHGGRIWVNSRPGKGSVFCFTLPFKRGRIKCTKYEA